MSNFSLNGNQVKFGERRIGWLTKIDGKKVFVSPRDRAKHFFRIWQGWGINEELLCWLEQEGFDEVHLRVHETEILISSLTSWRQNGIPYHKPPFEKQIVLPERYMRRKLLSPAQLLS